jgi:hypothetical protein
MTDPKEASYDRSAGRGAPMKLCINRCPRHGEFYSISFDDEDGCGTRVTPSKCCGQWKTIASWKLSARDWREIADLALVAAEDVAHG